MAGYAHILRLGEVIDTTGVRVPEFQFTYSDGDNSYARTFDETDLITFLTEDVALTSDVLDVALRDLRETGSSIIPDVHISGNDAAALGLQEVPSI
jgi:hypothetical protein